jgi:hypothetical protein
VLARRAANAPLAFINQYVQPLREYRAIAVDVGDQDGLKADSGKLHDVLTIYGIMHSFEIYSGTHTARTGTALELAVQGIPIGGMRGRGGRGRQAVIDDGVSKRPGVEEGPGRDPRRDRQRRRRDGLLRTLS